MRKGPGRLCRKSVSQDKTSGPPLNSSEMCGKVLQFAFVMTTNRLFRLPGAIRSNPLVDAWFTAHSGELGDVARHWFEVMRQTGADVRDLLHDGHPTACVGDAAFGYVNAFTAHVNVGFFHGSELPDPDRILVGAGQFMRHVKLRPGTPVDRTALARLIESAYTDIRLRLEAGEQE